MYSLGSFSLNHSDLFLFQAAELSLERQGLYLLTGLNGSGKTSLLNVLAARLAALPQKPKVSYMSALHSFERAMPVSAKAFFDLYSDVSIENADSGLVSQLQSKNISQMSSGEFQALLILAHLQSKRDIYIFDEPFSHLNPVWSDELSKKLVEISRHALLIIACHHLEEFNDVKKTTLRISDQLLEVVSA